MNSNKVVLYTSIEGTQRDALRYIGYKEKRSIADITREAIADYIIQYPIDLKSDEVLKALLKEIKEER